MGNQTKVLPLLEKTGIMPVVKLNRKEDAAPLGEALMKGGLAAAEITFRTDAAADSIAILRKIFPDMLVGAGTVTFPEQAKRAIDAGAAFLVSAGINRDVIELAIENDIPVFPGAVTPSEITTLVSYGLEVAKFFPAEQFGGIRTMKALSAPFPGIRFMPTGGINASNLQDYLAFEKVIAVGGSWMVKGSLIDEGKFDEIERLTAEAVGLCGKRGKSV